MSACSTGLPSPLTATRYHSLTIDPASLPAELEVTATTVDGTIMGVRHKVHDVEGVQFHPESVLTASGHDLLRTYLSPDACRTWRQDRSAQRRTAGRDVRPGRERSSTGVSPAVR